MLKTLFDRYKLYLVLALFVVWSGAVWHVSGKVKDADYTAERLAQAERMLKIEGENQQLAADIGKKIDEGIAKYLEAAKTNRKELIDEIHSDPRYSDCRITDSVRDNYKRKLRTQ